MDPNNAIDNMLIVADDGVIVDCTNHTRELGVVITEWGVKFIFDQPPNDDKSPIPVNLKDGQSSIIQSTDGRCCVGYLAYVKFTWPRGQDAQWLSGRAPAGSCYARFGVGLYPKKFVTLTDLASGKAPVEFVEI